MHSSVCEMLSSVFAFICAVTKEPDVKEQEEPLWEADWDDQDKTEDFQKKLKRELDKGMKE